MNLTYEEYEELSVDPVEVAIFTKLLDKAIQLIDIVTRHFYKFEDFDTDYDFRKSQVKAAIAFQIDYFNELGATTYEGINSLPQSVTLGRTSISQAARNSSSGNVQSKSLLCEESYYALSGTGLLNRGVYS